jgi:hypothetical protein
VFNVYLGHGEPDAGSNKSKKRYGHQRQFTYFRGRAYPSQGTKIAEESFSPKVTAEDVNVSKIEILLSLLSSHRIFKLLYRERLDRPRSII